MLASWSALPSVSALPRVMLVAVGAELATEPAGQGDQLHFQVIPGAGVQATAFGCSPFVAWHWEDPNPIYDHTFVLPPVVTGFSINNGASSTTNRRGTGQPKCFPSAASTSTRTSSQ